MLETCLYFYFSMWRNHIIIYVDTLLSSLHCRTFKGFFKQQLTTLRLSQYHILPA